jgi:hypothetical protein
MGQYKLCIDHTHIQIRQPNLLLKCLPSRIIPKHIPPNLQIKEVIIPKRPIPPGTPLKPQNIRRGELFLEIPSKVKEETIPVPANAKRLVCDLGDVDVPFGDKVVAEDGDTGCAGEGAGVEDFDGDGVDGGGCGAETPAVLEGSVRGFGRVDDHATPGEEDQELCP